MKHIYTFALILATAVLAKAQLFVDNTSNWQQYISTILGGNCVQISNVTYNAGNGTSALYSNFPGFGDGIIITTGQAAFAVGPNDESSAGIDNFLPGDLLLDQQIVGYQTYNATILEFDFVASYSGNVSVDYVFGSEEYEEFVNSSFNDVFGFFVSGGNINGVQNIALIPGTTTPVAINNVNMLLNSQYYVNNDNGTEVEYDGFTVPLTATFYADSGMVYHLKIAIADAGDGVFDSAVFLKTSALNTQSLSGNVTYQGLPVMAGFAELFGFNTDSTAAPLLDTQPIVNGDYTFNNIVSGAYNIRITMDTVLYPNTYPTYFDSAFVWYDADIVTTPCQNYNLGMGLMVLNPGGLGSISGTITGVNGPLKALGTPLENVHVLLVGENDNQVYGFELTNAQGQFAFSNIDNGTYKVVIDAPGLYMQAIRTVVIDDTHKLVTNQNYVIGTNVIALDETVGVDEVAVLGISLYPNPTADNASLRFTLAKNAVVKADIVDITGKLVADLYSGQMAAGKQQLQPSVKALSQGIYFIRLMVDGASVKTIKLIKSGN